MNKISKKTKVIPTVIIIVAVIGIILTTSQLLLNENRKSRVLKALDERYENALEMEIAICEEYMKEWDNILPAEPCNSFCGCGPSLDEVRTCEGLEDNHCKILMPVTTEDGTLDFVSGLIVDQLDKDGEVYQYLENFY